MMRQLLNHKSPFFSFLLCLFALILPKETFAEDYGIIVAGVQVTSENKDNVLGDDLSEEGSVASVSFDATTNTLTLNGAMIYAYNNEAVVSDLANLTIFLVGENIINGSNGFTFNKTSAVEETTVTFTTDGESNGSLYINNLEEKLFGEGVTPVYTDVSIKHDGDSHTIDSQLGISVGGIPVTLFNKDNVMGDGKVSYNAETHVLTLNNATIEPEEESSGIVYSNDEDLTIALIGDNSVQGAEACTAISHSYGVETPHLYFVKGDADQHFSLTLIAQSKDKLINGFYPDYGEFFVFDEKDDGTYTSTISSRVFGGTGSADEPFLIKTAEDLKKFAYYYNEGRFSNNVVHIKLYNDIDCEDEEDFTTIANNSAVTFYGVFDGNHKTISNLTMTGGGLFGYVSKDDDFGVGTIKDLTLSNFNLTGDDYATGGIVMELSNGAVVSNCTVANSTIACASGQYNPDMGGIVARLNSSTVKNCTVNNVQVKAETTYTGGSGPASSAGGIVGNASAGTVDSCVVMNGSKITCYYADEYATLNAGAIYGNQYETTLSENYYYYDVTVEMLNGTDVTNKIVKSGYEQRGVGGESYNEQTEETEANPDIFENNGAVMYTKPVTLPAESDEAIVMAEEGTYYSTVVEGDVLSILVAPGQIATVNAMPGEAYVISSLTPINISTGDTLRTSFVYGDNETRYTFIMPDAPVVVTLTTGEKIGIRVAGVEVTELNSGNVLGDGKVSYDAETKTLTLNGATVNGCIFNELKDSLTVHLVGENVIDGGYVSEDENGDWAFGTSAENATLLITTDVETPGKLLIKNCYLNELGNSKYYSGWYPSFKNGLVESENCGDKKVFIARGPVATPGEGVYWPDQEYTISGRENAVIKYEWDKDNEEHFSETTYTEPFTMETTGKYNLRYWQVVTVDDTSFNLYGSGSLYIVHNKPAFSLEAGRHEVDDNGLTITIGNLPENIYDEEYPFSYPQVWYYLDDNAEDSIRYTSSEQEILISESTKISVYILDEDSSKVVKSEPVEAMYELVPMTQLNISYAQNSREWASYYCTEEKSLAVPEGLKAYVVTEATATEVTVQEIGYIPQGEAVLLKRTTEVTEPIYAKEYTGATAEVADNLLIGTDDRTAVSSLSGNVYVLYNNAFTRAASGYIPANRGYLLLSREVESARIDIFDEETTGIRATRNEQTANDDVVYNLRGQRVTAPTKKGLYIINGKKVIKK